MNTIIFLSTNLRIPHFLWIGILLLDLLPIIPVYTNDTNQITKAGYTSVNLFIIDDITYESLPGADIRVTQNNELLPLEIQENSNGYYILDFPREGWYEIEINVENYFPHTEFLPVGEKMVKASTTDSTKIKLSRHYFASSTILDKFGYLIKDVIVQIGEQITITDETGYWKITALRESEYPAITSKKGYIFSSQKCILGNGENCHPNFNPDLALRLKVTSEPRIPSQGKM